MGMISITVEGSFTRPRTVRFGAMKHGHAHAVRVAIDALEQELLPEAIELDERLEAQGHAPSHGFPTDDTELEDVRVGADAR